MSAPSTQGVALTPSLSLIRKQPTLARISVQRLRVPQLCTPPLIANTPSVRTSFEPCLHAPPKTHAQASKLFLTEAEAAKLSDVCKQVCEGNLSVLGGWKCNVLAPVQVSGTLVCPRPPLLLLLILLTF